MRLIEIQIDGFGKLRGHRFAFDPQFTIVYGPNEAGKSTLAAAIVAALYGTGRRRDDCRPWDGAHYAARLRYVLGNGEEYEVTREFEESRGVRVRSGSGEDVSAAVVDGKSVSPGIVHLGVPLEVFVNATCVRQGEVAIDGDRADSIGLSLARALDGGPKEDAALGAIERLERALAQHVGTKRATVNVPLKRLVERAESADEQREIEHLRVRAQDDLRRRLDERREYIGALATSLHTADASARDLRAGLLQARLAGLHEIRDRVASLCAERAHYDDVAEFPTVRVAELEASFARWQERDDVAGDAIRAEAQSRLSTSDARELGALTASGAAVDDATFSRVRAETAGARNARDGRVFAAEALAEVQRREGEGDVLAGAAASATALTALGAIALAILHLWWPAAVLAVAAILCAVYAVRAVRRRRIRVAVERERRTTLDTATAAEAGASRRVIEALATLGVAGFEELADRRQRALELLAHREAADAAKRRCDEARARAEAAGKEFDTLANVLAPGSEAQVRARRLAVAKERGSRRNARDGIDLQLGMLGVRRGDVLGSDDEVALERELESLLSGGALPRSGANARALRAVDAERASTAAQLHEAEREVARLEAELGAAEAGGRDLAALDEETQELHEAVEQLRRFERAVSLARKTIDERMREAHEKFARRLADYATDAFAHVTSGRYTDLRVVPSTLDITVRVPETGELRELADLSAGTREQAFLVVRLAMARMFAEGGEVLPLMLDEPFVSWDSERIARGLLALRAAARDTQTIVFTSNDSLATAAQTAGAARLDLAV